MADAAMEAQGTFVVVDGLDGAQTLAHARNLATWLAAGGRRRAVHLTQEPSDGPVGMLIRMKLDRRLSIDGLSLAAFFAADRMDHLFQRHTGILARLKAGEHVVCERYYLSSFAYQSLQPGADWDWIWHLNEKCLVPDVTIFLDVPVDRCLQTIVSERLRGIHFVALDASPENAAAIRSQMEQVRNNYLRAIEWLRGKGQRVEIVAGDSPEGIDEEVRRIVAGFDRDRGGG